MKITEVIEHRLSYPIERPYRNSRFWMRERSARLVEVRTDSGLIGWGEGSGMPSEEVIEKHVIGADPFDYEVIYDALSENGREANKACGIEIALWDLMGKALDQPVYQLLGGARRTSVQAYASGFFQREGVDHFEDVAEQARKCRDLGFAALKARIGFGPDYDPQILAAMQKGAGEDIALAADVNLGYDVDTAIEAGHRLEAFDLLWYEEPIPREDLDGYCRLREELPIRISGAEGRVGVRSFQEVVDRQALDILQPDISIAGGFTECRRVWALAWANRIPVLPHFFGAVVRLAATLQWMATIPDDPEAPDALPTYLELDVMENGLRTDLSRTAFELEGGVMQIPDRPGLGVEIDEAALRKYAAK